MYARTLRVTYLTPKQVAAAAAVTEAADSAAVAASADSGAAVAVAAAVKTQMC